MFFYFLFSFLFNSLIACRVSVVNSRLNNCKPRKLISIFTLHRFSWMWIQCQDGLEEISCAGNINLRQESVGIYKNREMVKTSLY